MVFAKLFALFTGDMIGIAVVADELQSICFIENFRKGDLLDVTILAEQIDDMAELLREILESLMGRNRMETFIEGVITAIPIGMKIIP